MSNYTRKIRPFIDAELYAARDAGRQGDHGREFSHLERAHVLGQASTTQHVRVHWQMFLWGIRQHQGWECAGQILRIVGAVTKTALGLVPEGNTGGADISPFKRLPIPPELAAIIRECHLS